MSAPTRTPLRRTAAALVLLSASTVRRLLREGLVLRSMIWPGLVVCGTLVATVIVMAWLRPGRDVAVPLDVDPSLVAALEAADLRVHPSEDPRAAVAAGRDPVGTDGQQVWTYGQHFMGLEIESVVREWSGAAWRRVLPDPPSANEGGVQGRAISRVVGLLFVLYGLVFGLGGVARDRDDGTLEAELALPVPRWTAGMARWFASTLVLSGFFALTVAMLAALLSVDQVWALIRNGVAACGAAVAIGLAVVGTAGIKQGFSGPFALGMSLATGLAALGGAWDLTFVPVASLFSSSSGWVPLAVSGGLGLLSSWLFAVRSGRA